MTGHVDVDADRNAPILDRVPQRIVGGIADGAGAGDRVEMEAQRKSYSVFTAYAACSIAGLSPHEYVCKNWAENPKCFKSDPSAADCQVGLHLSGHVLINAQPCPLSGTDDEPEPLRV